MKVGLFQPSIPEHTTSSQSEPDGDRAAQPPVLFKDAGGAITDLSKMQGRVVFVNFWATWCPPCIAEMPTIQKLYSQMSDDAKMVFLMVDVDNNRAKSEAFMEKRGFDLPVYTPASGIPSNYLSGAIPTTLVFNKAGKVVFRHEGMGDFSNPEFQVFLEKLLAE